MSRPNLFEGTCALCGDSVPANAGVLEGPPDGVPAWRMRHVDGACRAVPVRPAPRVVFSLHEGRVLVQSVGTLDDERFRVFVRVCAASAVVFDPAGKKNTCAIATAGAVADRLTNAGFHVERTGELAATIQAHAAQAREVAAGATDRAAEIDARLRKSGKALYPFQRTGAAWLAPLKRALLADEMGLGKTIQVIAALPPNAAVLVVCPAIARAGWKRELESWRPKGFRFELMSRGDFEWPKPGHVRAISWESLPDSAKPPGYDVILVGDELQKIKNPDTRMAERWRNVKKHAAIVWGVSATPLENNVGELLATLEACDLLADSFGTRARFRAAFSTEPGERRGEWKYGKASPEVGDILRRVSLRRLQKDVWAEMPKLTVKNLQVDVDKATANVCGKALEAIVSRGIDLGKEIEQARQTGRLGVSFAELAGAMHSLSIAKTESAIKWAEEMEAANEPAVVFSAHVAPLEALAARQGWRKITGSETQRQRQSTIDAFQAGQLKGVALSIRAAGFAITLTRGAFALFVSREWNPAKNKQAIYRLLRIGQTRAVNVTVLVAAHALDERLTEILDAKTVAFEESVDASAIAEAAEKGLEPPPVLAANPQAPEHDDVWPGLFEPPSDAPTVLVNGASVDAHLAQEVANLAADAVDAPVTSTGFVCAPLAPLEDREPAPAFMPVRVCTPGRSLVVVPVVPPARLTEPVSARVAFDPEEPAPCYFLTDSVTDAIRAVGWRTNPKGLGWCQTCDHGTVLLDEVGRPAHVHCRDAREDSTRWRGRSAVTASRETVRS